MTFTQSISTCFHKYAIFSGRASRSEYWWFVLFNTLLNIVAGFIDELIGIDVQVASIVVSLVLLLPGLSVAIRRCHDSNHSGWWILCPIYNIILMFLPTVESGNQYE